MQWLIKHKIELRDSVNYKQPEWVLNFIKQLKSFTKIVQKVHLCDNNIIIEYKIGSKEMYTYTESEEEAKKRKPASNFPLLPRDCVLNKLPQLYYVYGQDMDSKPIASAHIMLRRKDLDTCSKMEKQLATRFFIQTLTKRKYVWPHHPIQEVIKDFKRLQNVRIEDYIKCFNGEYRLHKSTNSPSHLTPGAKVVDHFSYMKHCFRHWNHAKLIRAMKECVERQHDISYSMLLRMYWARNRINPFRNPGYYVSLFKHFNITGRILDVFPGVKLYACAALGLHYHSAQIIRWERCRQNSNHWFIHEALKHGLSEYFDFKHTAWAGDEVDWIIYDRFTRPRFDLFEEYLKYTKNLMVFIPNVYYETVYDSMRPVKSIPVYAGPLLYGHYFIW